MARATSTGPDVIVNYMAGKTNNIDSKGTRREPMPGGAYSPRIRGRVWLNVDDRGCFGIGKIALLEQIRRDGSISRAASAMRMSYKRAWDLVDAMNRIAGEPVVVTETGGRGGGGAHVTERGIRMIETYRDLEQRLIAFLRKESERIDFE